jgi:type I restriction-modification system DNA methylase subunit
MDTARVASKKLIQDFHLEEVGVPHFFRSEEDIEKQAGIHPYSHFMRRAWETMHLNGILCIEGKPTVYFKEVDGIDSQNQKECYQKFWNQGLATLLVLISPKEVQVFSSLANPVKEDSDLGDEHRLVEILELTAKALFYRRVQTGQIYRDYPESFQSDKTVDKFLLKNLRIARDELHKHQNLEYKVVHSLLGRIIFTCYLIERKIIGEQEFVEAGVKNVKNLRELFSQYKGIKARDILYDLFGILEKHFNGSVFDKTTECERQKIDEDHIEILRRILNVEELATGQRMFDFWAYNFEVIPVETISSIYEEFLAAEDEEEQRKSGAYYTPKHLAEMVVDVAVENWNLLDKRILDPACGSGIFLVILFNRIAEQWRCQNPRVHNKTRAEALLEIIKNQLCGIDLKETACRIACFSLYLAFLDQLKPREIHELEKKRGKVLDNFLALKKDNYKNTKTPVIFEGNFFEEVPVGKDFDLVIGNPPWVSRGNIVDDKALEWCLSKNNPYLENSPNRKDDKKKYFFPAKQIAHPFMWKSPVHLKQNGKACLVLPTKVLFNNQTEIFQAGWFSNITVDKVIQLSDWREILFENAICPAVIVRFGSQKPEGEYLINYEVPKVNDYDPRRGIITILPEDRKVMKLSEIQESAKKNEISVIWKKNFWGTKRDVLLIDRLLEMPRLSAIMGTPQKPKIFITQTGFKPYLPEYYELINGKHQPKTDEKGKKKFGEPKPIWWSKNRRYVDAKNKSINLILTNTDEDCSKFKNHRFQKSFTELYYSPEKNIFEPPMVIITKGFSKKIFCDFPIVFNNTFQSIVYSDSDSNKDAKLLMFLSAVLNSKLSDYYFFHVPANLGVERNQVFVNEIGLLPFPLPQDTYDPRESEKIINQIADLMRKFQKSMEENYIGREYQTQEAMKQIKPLVYKYYSISKREEMLIEDTVSIYKPSMMPSSESNNVRTIGATSPEERRGYVELLCNILNSWAKRSKFKVNGKIEYSSALGQAIITLWKSHEAKSVKQSPTLDELQTALESIMPELSKYSERFEYIRNLKVFIGNYLYILKPLARRFWTNTSAINEADEIASAILSSGRDN